MKSIALSFIFVFTLISSLFAQEMTKENIKVWGNCGMCKKTIEKAAKKAGAQSADWDSEKQMMAMSFDKSKTTSLKIQEAIAKTGYDTQDVTGDDAAYDKLHGCCQYERKSTADASQKACCEEPTCGKENSNCSSKGCCKGKNCCKS
jgi:mercuric ion binding protein